MKIWCKAAEKQTKARELIQQQARLICIEEERKERGRVCERESEREIATH